MMREVLLISKGHFGIPWRDTVLSRTEVNVREAEDYDSAYQVMLTQRPGFFVVDHRRGDEELALFLWRIRTSQWDPPPVGVLLTGHPDSALRRPPVVEVLGPPLCSRDFGRLMARLLDLPTRIEKRLLVAVDVTGRTSRGSTLTGTTVDLSPGGMLVSSRQPLPLGERPLWTFGGPEGLRGLSVPGTVLGPRGHGGEERRTFAIRFDAGAGNAMGRLRSFLESRG